MMARMLHEFIRFRRYILQETTEGMGTEPHSTTATVRGSVQTMDCFITAMESGWDSCSDLPKAVRHWAPMVKRSSELMVDCLASRIETAKGY